LGGDETVVTVFLDSKLEAGAIVPSTTPRGSPSWKVIMPVALLDSLREAGGYEHRVE
jgi:hypothetical protein